MKTSLFLPVLVLALIPTAAPGQETRYQKWLNDDVVYVISDVERAAFLRLSTDEEREQFVEQFWLRRDPTPGTAENEARTEHYRRISYANGRFGSAHVPGWRTPRGRVYILYGPPTEIESHPGRDTERWRYRAGTLADMTLEFRTLQGR